jgi:hypothetical protein
VGKREIHITITGDPSHMIEQLEKATEAARRLNRETRRRVQVLPRAAGVNLSVDVLVDGWHGNVPLPRNDSGVTRTDYFRIGYIEYAVRVRHGAAAIRAEDIEFRADLTGAWHG